MTDNNKVWTPLDTAFMAEAIQLAWKGLYTTEPNPRVGCVLVKGGKIVGRGWHQKAGEGHAEVNAIKDAGAEAKGSTAYVSLEPCSHFGKTPPCANALIQAGVARVVSAMKDPNPEVSGSGFDLLQKAGVQVESGLLESQAQALNVGFIKRMTTQRPFVRIKMAMSIDGRTAMASGESKWITGAAAREDVQRLRARSSAVISGIGTIFHDDASLTLRASELGLDDADEIAGRQPLRVILDSDAKISKGAKLFLSSAPILLVISSEAEVSDGIAQYPNVSVFRLPAKSNEKEENNTVEIVLAELARRGCNEILVEAGASLAGSFIRENCWDELVLYIAPKLMGSSARPLANLPMEYMSEAKSLQLKDMRVVGDDIRLTYHQGSLNLTDTCSPE
ncbi:MAG: diaminohydroxyphosphoribosylaminopyrimidine deaminase [Oleiphilaceae bacterium]|jgi:diaminohydroxyphosphoribosylaminopyrimidine deaminase/5-amino-6-(5-phosphoribosylamino)uracil reductase